MLVTIMLWVDAKSDVNSITLNSLLWFEKGYIVMSKLDLAEICINN